MGEGEEEEVDEEDEEEGGESRRPKYVIPWRSGSHHSNLSWIWATGWDRRAQMARRENKGNNKQQVKRDLR